MGWNSGYTQMEQDVICAYDKGILDKELLNKIMEPYKGTDCDSGGSNQLTTKDGKCVEHVICLIMKPEETKNAIENPIWEIPYEEIGITMYEKKWYAEPYWVANERARELFSDIWHNEWKCW